MKFYVWFLMPFFLLTSLAVAKDTAGVTTEPGPVEVTSQQMEANQQTGAIVFSGEVVAKRGRMTVYADLLTLYFVEETDARKIDHLEAEGGVRVVDGERVATADHMYYLQAEEKMTLTGDAKIHQGENQVAGEEIILFIRENRSLVKSSKDGRVKAVFLPQQETP